MSNTDRENENSLGDEAGAGDALDSKDRSSGGANSNASVLMTGSMATSSALGTASASASTDDGSDAGEASAGDGGEGDGEAGGLGSQGADPAGAAVAGQAGGLGGAKAGAGGKGPGGSGGTGSRSGGEGGSAGSGAASSSGEGSGGGGDSSGDGSGSGEETDGATSASSAAADAAMASATGGGSGTSSESGHVGSPSGSSSGSTSSSSAGGFNAPAGIDLSGSAAGRSAARDRDFIDPVCFRPGTRIATPEGWTLIEELRPGDAVRLADGGTERVRWIGRQVVDARAGDPLRVLPIRIRAGAIGPGLPSRDLYLSPDHAVAIDGVLIHAGALVDGWAISRESDGPDELLYLHVELPRHALLLAEGLAAESFVDNPERLAFDNWHEREALVGLAAPAHEMDLPRAKSARQVPGAIRRRLAARALLFDQAERALVA